MDSCRRIAGPLALSSLIILVCSAAPTVAEKTEAAGNSYYFYTKALLIDESGVARIPPRFQWSVETSFRGVDLQGKDLPDSRVMLRLYDPDRNFTALTAQMDLNTAARLHRDLGQIISKKMQDASYQHRPQLYDAKIIPTKRFAGVDKNGVAIVEDVAVHNDLLERP